ncbi:MAG: hypothetical protein ACYC0V_14200 [Armatimonadota bacterium]
MRKVKLLDMQKELLAKGAPQLAEKLKAETGYDAVARKARRNPGEIGAAHKHVPRSK